MSMSSGEETTLLVIYAVTGVLSFLGASFIVFSVFAFKKLRKWPTNMVLWIALMDMGSAVAYVFPGPKHPVACYFQAHLMSFCDLASILWTGCITFTVFALTVFQWQNRVARRRLWWVYHIFVWGVSFLLTALPNTTLSYGEAGAWCWISNTVAGKVWRFVQLYVPLWITVLVNLVLIICITVRIFLSYHRTRGDSSIKGAAQSLRRTMVIVRRLGLYPIILMVAWSWGTLNRIVQLFTNGESEFWIVVLHALFVGIKGFMNALVYGLANKVIVHEFRMLCTPKAKRGRSYSRDTISSARRSAGYEEHSDAFSDVATANMLDGNETDYFTEDEDERPLSRRFTESSGSGVSRAEQTDKSTRASMPAVIAHTELTGVEQQTRSSSVSVVSDRDRSDTTHSLTGVARLSTFARNDVALMSEGQRV